ncbi:MAG TPA: chaperone modulator CbpM [Kiloniellales bacterium]|nr:chaperone modulator CbpM [Kiloniellales bacterium]
MLMAFEQVVAEIRVEGAELSAWIEQNWVLPVERDGEFLFDETDLARARLIAELRRDLGVNDEAMPVVLRLLDQIYSLRRSMTQLQAAIRQLSPEARSQLKDALARETGRESGPDDDSR